MSLEQFSSLQLQSPSGRLLKDAYRVPVEQLVSDHYGLNWRVKAFSDMDEYASHPSAILSDGNISVFVKLSEAANGLDQFQVELEGLRLLSRLAGVLIPAPIGIVTAEGGAVLVLEALQAQERTPRHWRDIGRALGQIHLVKGARFGLEKQGYFGSLFQDNRPMHNWLEFFAERRLWPRLMGAIDAGILPTDVIRQVEKLIARLPAIEIPETAPALLHGDAQQNNFISTEGGAAIIDPAVYYGHPEMDLAHVDFFQAVPDDVFAGYREILPIEPGFAERRELWRIPAYLAVVTVSGEAVYLEKLVSALRAYL
ncbi:MAG: fructosamine kinase family protein [Chloroflexi bacterium]|nr:fructosamine kinase family protein [Chloroflexota bacterium]